MYCTFRLEEARQRHADHVTTCLTAFIRPKITTALLESRPEAEVKQIREEFFEDLRRRIEMEPESYDMQMILHLVHVEKDEERLC